MRGGRNVEVAVEVVGKVGRGGGGFDTAGRAPSQRQPTVKSATRRSPPLIALKFPSKTLAKLAVQPSSANRDPEKILHSLENLRNFTL